VFVILIIGLILSVVGAFLSEYLFKELTSCTTRLPADVLMRGTRSVQALVTIVTRFSPRLDTEGRDETPARPRSE